MERINFKNVEPYFKNGSFNWYFVKEVNDFLKQNQKENLPSIKDMMCFVVKNEEQNILDYVLIDDKQNVISSYKYSFEGYEQLMAKINILKVSKHYDEYEERDRKLNV